MAKQERVVKSGFVIKLSNETAQKLAEEEQQAKNKAEEEALKASEDEKSKESAKVEKQINITDTQNSVIKTRSEDNPMDKDTSVLETDQHPASEDSSIDDSKSDIDSGINITSKISDASHPSWGEYAPYITYVGEEAIYTDPTSRQQYTWSQETNAWVAKESDTNRVYSYENDTHVYTDADGSKCFWDEEKKAWLPKVDDDFLAFYQMSYGFVDNKPTEKKVEEKSKEAPKKPEEQAGVKRKNDPQWFEPSQEQNTKVYVSNLPLDLTEEEFVNFMQKCGLVERDPHTQKMKVKLYMDKEQNCFKGDALCTYIKIESVDLALNLLDGSDLKGNKIRVEKAHFELKGEYNPALKPKKKKKKELEKIKKMQQKLFDWRPEKIVGERSKHERVVILKNMFHSTDFDKEVQLILDYQQDLREEATKCGEVRKVVLYDRHPEGVAQITMKEPEQADAVVELMNGRWFGKRQITAEIWDGRTKYRIAETDADINKRIDKWDKFLEGKEEDKNDPSSDQTTAGSSVSMDVESSTEDTSQENSGKSEGPSVTPPKEVSKQENSGKSEGPSVTPPKEVSKQENSGKSEGPSVTPPKEVSKISNVVEDVKNVLE